MGRVYLPGASGVLFISSSLDVLVEVVYPTYAGGFSWLCFVSPIMPSLMPSVSCCLVHCPRNKHRQMLPFARHLHIILSKVPSSLVRRPPNLYAWAMSQSVSISRLVLSFRDKATAAATAEIIRRRYLNGACRFRQPRWSRILEPRGQRTTHATTAGRRLVSARIGLHPCLEHPERSAPRGCPAIGVTWHVRHHSLR